MVDKRHLVIIGLVFVIGILIFGKSPDDTSSPTIGSTNGLKSAGEASELKITVFKSPTCSCCSGWVEEMKQNGFQVVSVDTQDMSSIKEQYNVPEEMVSCHTAVIGDYFVEGHVPVEAVKKLIQEKPLVEGIALPGMPTGSPGMPGQKTGPFEVYALSNGMASLFYTE